MAYTINANAKNVWIRDNEDTRDLSIQTDASSVYLDNGRTLEQELGESSMVSNVATVDSAMSKVIDGTYDGAYESCVFKGKSLVNLSNLHKSFNNATLSGYYTDTSLCETSKLKLGTPYTLVFYTTVHGGDHDIYSGFELGVSDMLHATNAHPKTTTDYWGTLVKNGWSKMCVTFTDFLGYKYLSLRPVRCHVPESGKSIRFSIEGFILLEGDWSNKDLPFNDYFTGLCDVKMPILHNVGKNLFDEDNSMELGAWKADSSPIEVSNEIRCKNNFTPFPNGLKNGDVMRIVLSDTSINSNTNMHVYDESKTRIVTLGYGTSPYIEGTDFINGVSTVTIHDVSKCKYFSFRAVSTNTECKFAIMVNTSAPYEDYKTNILSTPEEVVLRGFDSMEDTLNLNTGEYVKRIGELTLDGSEYWQYAGNTDGTIRFNLPISDFKNYDTSSNGKNLINDKLPKTYFSISGNTYGVTTWCNHVVFYTEHTNVNDFKQWLSQNPTTVQYELAEPITTIVKPSTTTPFAYQNGHVILESGSEEQSLLPTLEYSTVVNRTGQVESVAKTIQTQEKQLTMLEQMLIQNIIGLDYNNTVLALNLEINEVM